MTVTQLKALQPSIEDKLLGLNESYAVVRWNSQTLIMNEIFDDEAQKKKISFLTKDGFLLWQLNNIFWDVSEDGKNKKLFVGKTWLEWINRRQFQEVVFFPNKTTSPDIYNLWRGFSFKPDPDAGKFDIFLDHLRVNICNEDEKNYQWLLGWMADLIQKPQRKLGTALVLRGKRGVGKGMVFKHLGALMHMHYLAVQKSEHVTGRFNGHLSDTILLFLDEAFWAGNKEAEGTLKSLITEDDVAIEMKGRDVYKIRSYIRIGMSTNNDWAVPAGLQDERRFAIFDVGTRCQQDRTYFSALEKQLKDGGYAALLHFLMNFEYDENLIAVIPKTGALLDQKLLSMSAEMRWWYNCLNDKRIAIVRGVGWEYEIERDRFYESYLNFCKTTNCRYPVGKGWLTRTLHKLKIQFKEEKDLQTTEGWFYKILPLEECRKSFEEVIGQSVEWEE